MAFMGIFLVFGAMAIFLFALFVIMIIFFVLSLTLFIVFTCLRKKNKACKIIQIVTIPFLVVSAIPVAIITGVLINSEIRANTLPADYVECPIAEFKDGLISFYDPDGKTYVEIANVIDYNKINAADCTQVFSYKPEGVKKQDWTNIYKGELPSGVNFYRLKERLNGSYCANYYYICEDDVSKNSSYNETHYINCFESSFSQSQKEFLDTMVNSYYESEYLATYSGEKLFSFERRDSYGYLRTHQISLYKTTDNKIFLTIDNGREVHGWYDEGSYEYESYQLTETDCARFLELFC